MPEQVIIRLPGTSRLGLIRELRSLPGILSGRLPDSRSYRPTLIGRLGHHLFTKIHEAFTAKSLGGSDEFGDRWKPLKRETIAQRPIVPGERKKLGILGLGRGGRGLLTAQQNRLWKGIFASTFRRLAPRVGEGEAKRRAASLAWGILKARGAKTKLEVLGSRQVPIHVVSHRLEESLKPGQLSGGQYTPPDEQVFQFQGRSLRMGTEVPYADRLHKTRRLWPPIRKMKPWIAKGLREGLKVLSQKIRG